MFMRNVLKKILPVAALCSAMCAYAVTFHRSFRNGYPTDSGPGRRTGAAIGVNGASLSASDSPSKAKEEKVQEKPKDDGTCWCLTASGKRCKNRKDGDKDYCKMHAANRRVAVSPKRCRALTWDGTRCTRAPEPGYNYCRQHGAKPQESKLPKQSK